MPLPSRDELRERWAASVESIGASATSAANRVRQAFVERPALGRGVGIGAATIIFVGVIIAVAMDQNSAQPVGGTGQLVVPAITSAPGATEQHGAPTVGAPPNPGAPPDPGPAGGAAPEPTAAAAPTASGQPSASGRVAEPPVAGAPAAQSSTSAAPPAAAPPSAEPSRPEEGAVPTEHQVIRGETLAQIALRYNVPFEQIAADSGVANPNRIRPGQRLLIRAKPAGVEVIAPGRTLSDYARSSGRRLDELMRLNPQLTNPNRILAGGRLNV